MEQVIAYLRPDEPAYTEAAARLGQDALPHLTALARQSDQHIAAAAAYLAGLIGSEKAAEAVSAAMAHSNPAVRVAAAAAAQHLPPPAAETVLSQALRDKDTGVRRVALDSIPARASTALRAVVEQASLHDPDPGLRRKASGVLQRMPR